MTWCDMIWLEALTDWSELISRFGPVRKWNVFRQTERIALPKLFMVLVSFVRNISQLGNTHELHLGTDRCGRLILTNRQVFIQLSAKLAQDTKSKKNRARPLKVSDTDYCHSKIPFTPKSKCSSFFLLRLKFIGTQFVHRVRPVQ